MPDGDLPDLPTFPDFDTTVAHPARRYDYWLGGKDNFRADRESGDQIAAVFPQIRTAVRANRQFLRRAVEYLVRETGITQFLDIGTGLPAADNTHEVAQRHNPRARIVYVDNDPIVLVHARALLTSTPEGATAYLDADVRDPRKILTSDEVTRVLNLDEPVAVMLIAVMQFVDDADDPHGIVGQLLDPLAPGSYLTMSHPTYDTIPPEVVYRLRSMATGAAGFTPRPGADFARFFTGLDLVDPGVSLISDWRPDDATTTGLTPQEVATYGAVARKP